MSAQQIVQKIKTYLAKAKKAGVDNIAIKGVDILQRNVRESGKNASPSWKLSKKVNSPYLSKKYGNKTLIYRGNLSLFGARKNYTLGRVSFLPGVASKEYAAIQFFGGTIYRKGREYLFQRRGDKDSKQMKFARNNRKRGIVHTKQGKDYKITIDGRDYLNIPPVYHKNILEVVQLAYKIN